MSEDNNIEEGLVDTGAKVLGGIYKAAKSKLTAPKMQVTTPAGKTYNMPRGSTSTQVGVASQKGSGLKPVGLGTAAVAGGAVGAGVYGYQKAKEYANEPTKLPDIDVPAKKTETPKTSAAAEPKKPMSFSQAFKSAREKATEAGKPSSGQFEFKGKTYQTNIKGEKYVPMSQQTKIDTPKSDLVPLPPSRPTDLNKPESESGGKKRKMSEETNPLIAAFLKLQENNPSNMFEAAKKAKKDYDKDGKIESPKDEVWGSRFRAAKMAGKMEEGMIDPKDPSVQGGGDVTSTPEKPAKPVAPKKVDRDPSYQGSGEVTKSGKPVSVREEEYVEEVQFSQAEIDHINSFFEAVAPSRPEPTKGVNPTVSNTSLTDETIEEGRPKKNPTPETTERDARQHIQVIAGRAAAGNTLDFPHNDGSKSKITPAMGRKITSHLQGLKPAERQAAVNKMHASAEGLKV